MWTSRYDIWLAVQCTSLVCCYFKPEVGAYVTEICSGLVILSSKCCSDDSIVNILCFVEHITGCCSLEL